MLILVTRYSLKKKSKKEKDRDTTETTTYKQDTSWAKQSLNRASGDLLATDDDPERDFSIDTGFRPLNNVEAGFERSEYKRKMTMDCDSESDLGISLLRI